MSGLGKTSWKPLAGMLASSFLFGACVRTDLSLPADHPGNPAAVSRSLPSVGGLKSDFSDADADAETAHGHAEAKHVHPEGEHCHGHAEAEPGHAEAEPAPPAAEQQAPSQTPDVSYTCPMHPEVVSKDPGRCPICGMKLVPKKKDGK